MSDQSSTSLSAVVPVAEQVGRANDSGRVPVVFIHGLWLHPLSWTEWAGLFQAAGYRTMAPGWPGVPDTVQAARANPDSGVTVAELEA